MTELSQLIERLERADGPDEELARLVCQHFIERDDYPDIATLLVRAIGEGSLDAAVALCEAKLPGWTRLISHNYNFIRGIVTNPCKRFVAEVRPIRLPSGKLNEEDSFDVVGYGSSEALALVIALLKSLQAKEARG